MITQLIEIGCFNVSNLTPLDAVLEADFAEAVSILSLRNAGLFQKN